LTLEDRISALERENRMLKQEIQGTLISVRENLGQSSTSSSDERWSRRAWVLALLNLTLALTLFVNVNYFTLEGLPADLSVDTVMRLRSLWIALSFIWLVLQLYPLIMLYEAEERALRCVAWRNAVRVLVSNPAVLVSLTCAVLLIALASAIAPTLWIWAVVAMAALVVSLGMRRLLGSIFEKVGNYSAIAELQNRTNQRQ
jgi:hypothetical protein